MGAARDVVQRFNDDFNTRRVDRAEAERIFDPGIVSVDPTGTYSGIDAFLGYVQGYITAFPDSKLNPMHIVESGDLVIVEGEYTGTNTGPIASPQGTMPATGKSIRLPYADVFEVKNGKIAKHRTYFDQMTMLGQLGMLPAPTKA
jgi:steroid delta-isomerase-like uncharacterized protein